MERYEVRGGGALAMVNEKMRSEWNIAANHRQLQSLRLG